MDKVQSLSSDLKAMEIDNFARTEDIEFLNLDHLQQIPSIFQKSPRSESSHSFNQAGIKEMSMLSPPAYEMKQRHFSAGYVHDQVKKDDPVSNRLKIAYKSAKSPLPVYPETISIAGSTHFEHVEIDAGEPPPIDESLFFETLEPLRNVEIDGINLMSLIWNTVSVSEMKLLVEMENGNVPEREGILFPDSDERFKSIAFSWACFRGLTNLLPKLEASGADIHNVYFTGSNAVMIACFSGEISCLKYLIERNVNLNYINPLDSQSCLHSAAAGNSPEAAQFVLDHGGNLNLPGISNIKPLLHYAIRVNSEAVAEVFLERGANPNQKNCLGETPLHIACYTQSLHCCKLLLQKPEVDVNALDAMDRTPLHYVTMSTCSNVKLVELLLKHGALINPIDKTGFSPLHIASLNEQSECVETLIWNGADVSVTTSKGVSALNIILRKIPESFEVFRIKLDSSIRLNRPALQNREWEMRLDFGSLLPSDNKPETSFINTFILENQKNLLSHPLVMAFLYLKWEKIRKFYLFSIFLYTMTVIFMTSYVLTALAYKCYNSSDANNSTNKHLICFYFHKRIIQFEWYMWLILTCFSLPRKVLNLATCKCTHRYMWSIDNLLDAIVIISMFATSFVYAGKTYDWQSYIGAFAILCAWTNLMLMIGQLPAFGTYVAMFTHIQFEFAKLLLAYSGLIIGFTVSFCVIFTGEPSFGNPFTALIKILAMMSGELDFEGLINQSHLSANYSVVTYHPLSICAQVLFTLFVIFITVILMNLLVGIAVHDIQGLRNHAGLSKLVRQTKLIAYTEMAQSKVKVPSFLKKWLPNNQIDVQTRKHVLVVKPLNPMEKRLPPDILKAAFEIAQKTSPMANDENMDSSKQVPWMQQLTTQDTQSNLQSAIEKLDLQMKLNADEIHDVKDQLRDARQILETIMSKLL